MNKTVYNTVIHLLCRYDLALLPIQIHFCPVRDRATNHDRLSNMIPENASGAAEAFSTTTKMAVANVEPVVGLFNCVQRHFCPRHFEI